MLCPTYSYAGVVAECQAGYAPSVGTAVGAGHLVIGEQLRLFSQLTIFDFGILEIFND
jgi:hypothetical protein